MTNAILAADPVPPAIVLVPGAVPNAALEVRGLSADIVKSAQALPKDDSRWKALLSVRVAGVPESDTPPMLGSYDVHGSAIRFRPRFPLERGLSYRAKFDAAKLPGARGVKVIEQEIVIAKSAPREPARVSAVFPSEAELPENLLRIYVHFSAPMEQGDSYRFVRIVDDVGKAVERPFLELPQELWNSDGTRLTLLLDPGRVKQGLVPRAEAGPVLVVGRKYELQIDKAWRDAEGRPLAEPSSKKFSAIRADTTQPDVNQWKVNAPVSGSRDPLSVRFPDPLDEAMLRRALRVVKDETGDQAAQAEPLSGEIGIGQGETEWRFTPRDAWAGGRYSLVVATTLEDRAGNSIGRPFEVDLRRTPKPAAVAETASLRFEVSAR